MTDAPRPAATRPGRAYNVAEVATRAEPRGRRWIWGAVGCVSGIAVMAMAIAALVLAGVGLFGLWIDFGMSTILLRFDPRHLLFAAPVVATVALLGGFAAFLVQRRL